MIIRPAIEKADSTATNGFDHELPPIEAYAEDFEASAVPASPQQSGPKAAATSSPIRIRCAAEVAAVIPRAQYVLRPYIERDAMIFTYGDYGVFKSFVVVDWAMRVGLGGLPAIGYNWPCQRADVVLVSAEGRALPQRLRAWCIRNFPGEDVQQILVRASLYCIEHPVNLSDPASADALVAVVDELGITPGLFIIDTMSRNSDGGIEESTSSAGAYIAIIDQRIRSRYRCAVVMTHHVGHDKTRMRGPIALAGNTDVLIRIERPDKAQRVVSVTIERTKDSEEGQTQALRGCVVELGEVDEDGQPMTSLALEATEALPPPPVAGKQPQGKAQRQLLAALRAQDGAPMWTIEEIREVARKAGITSKGTRRSAAEWLTTSPYMVAVVGGWKLANDQG